MDLIRRRFVRQGHGAPSSPTTHRPRIGRNALVVFALLFGAVTSPTAASAAVGPEGRVISGNGVPPADVGPAGRWSAVVAVFATDGDGTRLCTGTLVAPNWVATAAHCLAQSSNASQSIAAADVYVAPGITSVATAGDHLVNAVSTRVHPGFSWANASWDAALIELETTIPSTPFALPDPLRPDAYVPGTTDNVAGFGRAMATDGGSSGTLRTGRLEQVSPSACAAYNPGSSTYADCYLPGTARQATCFGDSGGPLIRFDNTQGGKPVLWGITSTGPDPCDAATGGAFAPAFETRVTAVVDWFKAMMSGSTYVPTPAPTSRTAGQPGATSPTAPANGSGRTNKAPPGGTGIGIFESKINRAPSAKRAGKVTLTASFVGATGSGLVEIEVCKRNKCKTAKRADIAFKSIATAVRTTISVPKCSKGVTTLNLKLSVRDSSGALRDTASQRIARCRR